MIRKIIVVAMLAASIGSIATPASAAVGVQYAPPLSYTESVPAARRGQIWVAGHWEWRNDHHQWVKGAWLARRAGWQYHHPKWVERSGAWYMEGGNWTRGGDADGDGIRNNRDAAPNNPNRS